MTGGHHNGDLETGSHILSFPANGHEGSCGNTRLRCDFDPTRLVPDAISVVDVDPASPTYSRMIGTVTMPNVGDELHHFGWNACSSCLCPNAPHPHSERRYLIVPGLRSSRIHILDTKANPHEPKIVRVLEPEEVAERSGYTRPQYDSLRTGRHLRRRAEQC